jgi:hypothetical protein
MTATDERVSLLLPGDVYADLWDLARNTRASGAGTLRRAIAWPVEVTSEPTFRVSLHPMDVVFVREHGPEIVARYPAVFDGEGA